MNRGVGGDIISLTNFIHYRTNTRSNSSMFRISKIAGIFILMTILLMSYSTAKNQLYDESTFSNINEINTVNFNLTLSFDFQNKIINGTQKISVKALKDDVCNVVLDIWNLNITSVMMFGWTKLDYTIEDPNPVLGKALNISVPCLEEEQVIDIQIKYTTQAINSGSWLSPEQTADKKLSYFFTQCQSIYCRNLAPLQDTPAIKSTYNVAIITPSEYVARVSGNLTSEETYCGKKITTFNMAIPVESYLLAVAVGDLAEAKVGNRTYVITEPSMLQNAANELSELEQNLVRAENYLTPYEWGDYKILILPPSFPFGGMENPLLTFASPTIIVGDKSSVDVATHEIAHSWTGNLITNMNWENFWLNEGFTVFTERKVTKMKQGDAFYNVASKLGNYSMVADMQNYGWNHTYSSLTPKMHGANPDDSYSSIPYEKGFQFVTYLESLVGEDKFQKFYRQYIKEFKYKSITVDDMKNSYIEFVRENFDEIKAESILKQIDWDTWIYKPGLPPVILDFESQEYDDAIALAQSYIDGKGEVSPPEKEKYKTWFVSLKGIFLSELLHAKNVTDKVITLVDKDLNVSKEINSEILYLWYQLAITYQKDEVPFSDEVEFLKSVGRLKYIQPIFFALYSVNSKFAVDTYHQICNQYHPIAQAYLEQGMKTSKCGSSTSIIQKLLTE